MMIRLNARPVRWHDRPRMGPFYADPGVVQPRL